MQETVRQFLAEHRIPRNAGFIVTVSGGADSIALLHIFKSLNLKIIALHCNFSLRGEESDMDELFVKRFCDELGVKLITRRFNTTEYAKEKGISIEMAARELRYDWFREIKTSEKMDYIVIAHHADDVAETLFINLCRGTGIKGLTGIKAVYGDLLRPLLTRSRIDILAYLEKHLIGYRTDSTNNTLDYMRNKIRHKIIPVCKEINPAFLSTIEENCRILTEVESIYRHGIEQLKEQIIETDGNETLIHIAKTLSSPAPRTLLYDILHPFGFNKTQINDILAGAPSISGSQFHVGNYILTKERSHWRIYQPTDNHQHHLIPQTGDYLIAGAIYRFTIVPKDEQFQIPTSPRIACLDADKTTFPLTVRNWQQGDRFCPIGMAKSQKKLSDFFVDLKFTDKQKRECLMLLSGNKIAWVINYRPDDRFKITHTTRNILKIETL